MKRVAVITGASRGIGLALAKKMLSNGYSVIGTSRDGKIEAIQDKNLYPMVLDVTKTSSIQDFNKLVKEQFKIIDILINNAGIGHDLGANYPDLKSFKDTFEVNVTGTVFLTESIIPMIKKEGKLIIVSSKMGSIDLTDSFDSVAYKMSKSALNMYTKILSNRLEGNIKVGAVDPGWVQTEIRMSNLENAPLTPKESANNIYEFILSDFKSGMFWGSSVREQRNW